MKFTSKFDRKQSDRQHTKLPLFHSFHNSKPETRAAREHRELIEHVRWLEQVADAARRVA